MQSTERITGNENLPVKEARRQLKTVEQQAQSLFDTHKPEFAHQRLIARMAYNLGLRGLSQKVAPIHFSELSLRAAREIFERSKALSDGKKEVDSAPVATDFHTKPITRHQSEVAPVRDQTNEVVLANFVKSDLQEQEVYEVPTLQSEASEVPIHWSEWYSIVEKASEEQVETGPRYFDETTRKVGLTKKTIFENIVVPQTNETLEDFVLDSAKRLGGSRYRQLKEDLDQVVRYIIDNPVGNHSKVLSQATIGFNKKTHRLRRVDPHAVPDRNYQSLTTNKLRVIYTLDNNSVVFFGIMTHDEMMTLGFKRRVV